MNQRWYFCGFYEPQFLLSLILNLGWLKLPSRRFLHAHNLTKTNSSIWNSSLETNTKCWITVKFLCTIFLSQIGYFWSVLNLTNLITFDDKLIAFCHEEYILFFPLGCQSKWNKRIEAIWCKCKKVKCQMRQMCITRLSLQWLFDWTNVNSLPAKRMKWSILIKSMKEILALVWHANGLLYKFSCFFVSFSSFVHFVDVSSGQISSIFDKFFISFTAEWMSHFVCYGNNIHSHPQKLIILVSW